jgi:histidine kinase
MIHNYAARKSDIDTLLSEGEDHYRTILEVSPEPIVVYDPAGRVIYMNKAFEDVFGWTFEELLGRQIAFVPESEEEKTRKAIDTLMEKGTATLESRRLTRNGDLKDVDIKASVFHGRLGELMGSIVTIRDITDHKRAEKKLESAYESLKILQSQVIQAGKLSAIGELAAGVAHELNQPLMVIRTTIQYMLRKFKKNTLDIDLIEPDFLSIERNTKRMMNIINHLRIFSRQTHEDHKPIILNQLFQDCLLMIGQQLKVKNIEVTINLSSDLPKVMGNINQLEQVFLNLITNARDAISAKVETIKTHEIYKGEIGITAYPSKENKDYITIIVKDNGCGIPVDDMVTIFDPFFTTKEVGKGTGLGLSVTYGIIKDHKGDILVADSGPHGTVFQINLLTIN